MSAGAVMRPGLRLALFGVALASAFGVGAVVGAAVGPIDVGGEVQTSIPVPGAEPEHGQHG